MEEKLFDPKEIGMETCPDCNSYGRRDGKVCRRCGGFGFIIKAEDAPIKQETENRGAGETENQR
jgi:DnaJ-class molecular chaperone